MSYRIPSRDEHFQNPGRKRILALDGGGLRGILTLGILQQIEKTLRVRHGDDPKFRLCHYFDLIAARLPERSSRRRSQLGWRSRK